MRIKYFAASLLKIVFTLLLVSPLNLLFSQVILLPDSLYGNVPYGENFQSIEMEYISSKDSILLYTAFDIVSAGIVNVYNTKSHYRAKEFKLVRSFRLPYDFRHPNDIQIKGDTLLVTGWNKEEMSHIGLFNKYNGDTIRIFNDSLSKGSKLWASYIFKDTLYRIIEKGSAVEVEFEDSGSFKKVVRLNPTPIRDQYNYIQGCTVLFDRLLGIITSSPTRVDLYDLKDGYAYKGRIFGEDGGLESEGITFIDKNDTTFIYYGLRYPNKINVTFFAHHLQKPSLVFPENNSIIATNTVSFAWKALSSAMNYEINVSFDSSYTHIARKDTTLVNALYISSLPGSGPYFWRTRPKNIFGTGPWSTTNKVILDIVVKSEIISHQVPDQLRVWQNFPNPFNASTTIEFYSPDVQNIRVRIYDIAGNIIKTISDGPYTKGHHSLSFDGSTISSGTYYCVVESKVQKRMIKTVLLK